MNRKQREQKLAIIKYEQMVVGIKKEATDTAVIIMSYIGIMYLRDELGYGKKRLERFMDYVETMLADIGMERLNFKDMIDVIEEETGYKYVLPMKRF